jgi:hypothetical protein
MISNKKKKKEQNKKCKTKSAEKLGKLFVTPNKAFLIWILILRVLLQNHFPYLIFGNFAVIRKEYN